MGPFLSENCEPTHGMTYWFGKKNTIFDIDRLQA